MGREIDLLANYPKTTRDVTGRGATKTAADRAVARRFGRRYFDGERRHGYGGFSYHPRFWQPVIPAFQSHFGLTAGDRVLDVGCGKGFMLHDLAEQIPGIRVHGLDISAYAITNALKSMRPYLHIGNAAALAFKDNSFDVVIAINTLHNLDPDGCARALREIERVSCAGSFITVDAYRSAEEKTRIDAWNLTAKTILHVDQWTALFDETGYTGDYYWFIP